MSNTPGEAPIEGESASRGFFEHHTRFLETSAAAASKHRLNLRYEAMIDANRDILDGARVLDIASHDGRWSFAALKAGASHVTGIEARPALVDNARETFAAYGASPDAYRLLCGDVFGVFAQEQFDVDVVFCFGFLYHTLRYPEIFAAIRRSDPSYLVVDTKVAQHADPVIRLAVNNAKVQSHAVADAYSSGRATLAGWPSASATTQMLEVYDFHLESTYDWNELISRRGGAGAKDYASGERVTMRFRSR